MNRSTAVCLKRRTREDFLKHIQDFVTVLSLKNILTISTDEYLHKQCQKLYTMLLSFQTFLFTETGVRVLIYEND